MLPLKLISVNNWTVTGELSDLIKELIKWSASLLLLVCEREDRNIASIAVAIVGVGGFLKTEAFCIDMTCEIKGTMPHSFNYHFLGRFFMQLFFVIYSSLWTTY